SAARRPSRSAAGGDPGGRFGDDEHVLDDPAAVALAARLIRLIWFLLTVAESIVALRVLFRALGSGNEGFVRFVYAISIPLVGPFRPIVRDQPVGGDGRRVVEVSSLIAMVLLFLAAYLLVTLIGIVVGPPD